MYRRILASASAAALFTVLIGHPAAAAVTTGHTGSGAPGLASAGDRLYVAWTGSSGTAAAKEVLLGWSTNGGRSVVKVGQAERAPQDVGPALVADPDAPGVFMAWPDGRNGNTLTIVRYDTSGFSCRTAFPA